MELSPEQKEFLKPAMEEFEKGKLHSVYNFGEIWRVTQVRKEIGYERKFCNSCGADKVNYYEEIYNL